MSEIKSSQLQTIGQQIRDTPAVPLSINQSWQDLLRDAAANANAAIRGVDLDVIVAKLASAGPIDDAAIDRLRQGLLELRDRQIISAETADKYLGQVLGEISYRVRSRGEALLASSTHLDSSHPNVAKWETFADNRYSATAVRKQMAEALAEGKALDGAQLEALLDRAMRNDDHVTLWEIQAMYRGIDQAARSGALNQTQREEMYGQLDRLLTIRINDPGAVGNAAFNDNATLFIRMYLGATSSVSNDSAQYRFDRPERAELFVRRLLDDGALSPQEVNVAFQTLIRDGKATPGEIQAVGDVLASAAQQGVISYSEYATAVEKLNTRLCQRVHGGIITQGFDVFGLDRIDRSAGVRTVTATLAADPANQRLDTAKLDRLFGSLGADGNISLKEIHAVYDGVADAARAGKVSKTDLAAIYGELDSYLSRAMDRSSQTWSRISPEAEVFLRDRVGAHMSIGDVDAVLDSVERGEHAAGGPLPPGKGEEAAVIPGKGQPSIEPGKGVDAP